MAFRFRKSKSIIPGVRINLTPKGLGISAGMRGMRVSRSATGQESISAGIPGSGISYRKQIKKRKLQKSKEHFQETPTPSHLVASSIYIAKHGPVLTKREIYQSLIYLLLFSICLVFWLFSLIIDSKSVNTNTYFFASILFCILYLRASSKNKKRWADRTQAHLKNCDHNELPLDETKN